MEDSLIQEEIEFLKSLKKRRAKRKPIPVETIEEILKERGYICELCDSKLDSKQNTQRQRQLHHIIPRRNGGNNQKDNLLLICRRCHECMESTIYSGEMKWRREISKRIKILKTLVSEEAN